eukprot:scaffold491524_cov30-Prasinocladus_malaysianus.AAC.2
MNIQRLLRENIAAAEAYPQLLRTHPCSKMTAQLPLFALALPVVFEAGDEPSRSEVLVLVRTAFRARIFPPPT